MEHDKRTWGSHLTDTVVVIDDSRQVTETLAHSLRAARYEVYTAEDGMTGLSLVRRFRPKVVILDVFMPHMSGYEVVDAIRDDSLLTGIVVIVITGMARDEKELREMGESADICLVKPVDVESLLETVGRTIGSHDTEPGLRKHLQ